jgi:hypothetical protein
MSSSGVDVFNCEVFEQLLGSSSTAFLALVSDEIYWGTKATDPVVEDGLGNSCCLLGRESHLLDILGEGIHDAQDVLFPSWGSFEGPK